MQFKMDKCDDIHPTASHILTCMFDNKVNLLSHTYVPPPPLLTPHVSAHAPTRCSEIPDQRFANINKGLLFLLSNFEILK